MTSKSNTLGTLVQEMKYNKRTEDNCIEIQRKIDFKPNHTDTVL